jgi:hypothetical protein
VPRSGCQVGVVESEGIGKAGRVEALQGDGKALLLLLLLLLLLSSSSSSHGYLTCLNQRRYLFIAMASTS